MEGRPHSSDERRVDEPASWLHFVHLSFVAVHRRATGWSGMPHAISSTAAWCQIEPTDAFPRDNLEVVKLHAGLEVNSSLHLLQPLARGGMGSVWIAEHRSLERQVAVKFLSTELVRDETARKRFAQEATAAAQIRSPHAVHIYDHGIFNDEVPYIVMELVEGEDLGARFDRNERLSLTQATAVLVQVARVLRVAHSLGIVHRDIKPGNIIVLDEYDEFFVKLIDFGIAKVSSTEVGITGTGVAMGTVSYMSPEQFEDAKNVGPEADQWGLAVVLYEALTGSRPFPGESLPAVILSINSGILSLPYQSCGTGSPAIDGFFAQALHRDPSRRHSSFEAMVEAWREAVDATRKVKASSAVGLEALPTSVSRRRLWVGSIVGIVFSAVLGFFAVSFLTKPDETKPDDTIHLVGAQVEERAPILRTQSKEVSSEPDAPPPDMPETTRREPETSTAEPETSTAEPDPDPSTQDESQTAPPVSATEKTPSPKPSPKPILIDRGF